MSEEAKAVEAGGPLANGIAFVRAHVRERATLLACLALAGLAGALYLSPAYAIYLVSRVVLAGDRVAGHILPIVGLAAGSALLCIVARAGATILGHRIAFDLQARLRLRLLGRVAALPTPRLEGRAADIRKVVVADVDRLEGLLAHVLPNLVSGLATTATGLVLLALADWRMAVASLGLLPVAFLAQRWTYRSGNAQLFAEWGAAETAASQAMLSYLRGIVTLRAFNRQASSLDHVRGAVHALRDLSAEITIRARYSYSLFQACLSTSLLVVLPAGLWLYRAEAITAAEFVLLQAVGAGIGAPLAKVIFALEVAQRQADALARIGALLAETTLRDGESVALPSGDTIVFEDVEYRAEDGRAILSGISVTFPAGRTTAIVGPSGAGKSTMVALLLRNADVSSGRILLGGVDLRDLPLATTRARMSAVFQHPVLFHGTVANNIRMARPDATDAAYQAAIREARVDTIRTRDGGVLDSQVADRGVGLSGGERQRVAVARALLKQAPILVLDEATDAVDAENEAAVRHALSVAGAGRTLIVIGHRLANLVGADQIVVLDGGRVEAVGAPSDLLECSPTYARLQAAHHAAQGWELGHAARRKGRVRAET